MNPNYQDQPERCKKHYCVRGRCGNPKHRNCMECHATAKDAAAIPSDQRISDEVGRITAAPQGVKHEQ